jgi:hypothetical protein
VQAGQHQREHEPAAEVSRTLQEAAPCAVDTATRVARWTRHADLKLTICEE